jgi:hypothetical protein
MAKLRNPEPTAVIDATEEPAMNRTQRTQTRRAGLRQLVALAAIVALLLALATAAALRQATATHPASRAPAAPALAHDGYVPTSMDFREDHRVSAPAYGTDSLNYREDHRTDAPTAANVPQGTGPCPGRDLALTGACGLTADAPPLAADGYMPTRMDYREDHRLATPAYVPSRMDYREDHRADATPAAGPSGGAAPVCNGGACIVP